MTTIDRAGLAAELRAWARHTRVGSDHVAIRAADELDAALRKPDQEGEAMPWLSRAELGAGIKKAFPDLTDFEAEASAETVWQECLREPQPAPEAGKLPSVVVDALTFYYEHWDQGGMIERPNEQLLQDQGSRAGWALKAIGMLDGALLSPAQPHDVPVEDGDGLVARLRDAGSNRRRPASGFILGGTDALLFLEAADALEAQGRRIAKLIDAGAYLIDRLRTVAFKQTPVRDLAEAEAGWEAVARASRSTSGRA